VRNRALDLAPAIQELQAAGCESLRAIAAGLEERGIPAPRGGSWSAVQVARVLEAAAIPFDASVGAAEDTSNMLRLVQGLRNRSDIQLTTQLLGKRI
jgi:Recombinase